MDFPSHVARLIDGVIEPFSPRSVRRRVAERLALKEIRAYDIASNSRRNQNWRRPSTSADGEVRQGLVKARNSARELVRNNKYAASAFKQVVANLVGDGISAQAIHSDKAIQQKAQDAFDRFAESKVDGRNDLYGVQRLAVRAMIEGGEGLVVWNPDKTGPDGRCRVLEGDFLDHLKQDDRNGAGRIVQGVEFDDIADRSGYWLFDRHPGDSGGYFGQAHRFDAAHVDHVFDELRAGQTRGVSWFAPVAMTLRDLGEYEDAILMKKKVEACLALILTPGEDGNPTDPFAAGDERSQADGGKARKQPDTIRPGMVFRTRPGETATTLTPSASGDGVDFAKWQMMGVSANLAPYHMVTGDPSKANYASLRAMNLAFWANLDDWQQNLLIPHLCKPAVARRMARLRIETGDRRFEEVRWRFAMPVRRFADPIKDAAGEIMEIRGGLKTMAKALMERGINPEDHIKEIADFNLLADIAKLALETDPRRVTDSGVLQAAAGYLSALAKEGN